MPELKTTSLFTDPNLKAYYRFESGFLTTDTKNSHTLTAISDPAETTGKFGGGVTLDGDDAYSAVDHADFKPTGNFTISCWIKTSTTGANQTFFQSYTAVSGSINRAGFLFRITSTNVLRFETSNNTALDGAGSIVAVGTITVTDGNWHLATAVWDGTKFRIYVDGVEDVNINGQNAVYGATNYVRIGCQHSDGTDTLFLTGSLDDVALFDRALTAVEVLQLYKQSSAWFLL